MKFRKSLFINWISASALACVFLGTAAFAQVGAAGGCGSFSNPYSLGYPVMAPSFFSYCPNFTGNTSSLFQTAPLLQTTPYQLSSPFGATPSFGSPFLPNSPLAYSNFLTQQVQAETTLYSRTRIRTDAHTRIKQEVVPQIVATNKHEVCHCSTDSPTAPPPQPDLTAQSDLDQCKIHEVQNLPGSGQFGSHTLISVAADPLNPKVIYGISGDQSYYVQPLKNQAVYVSKSTDGGKTWEGIARIPQADFGDNEGLRNGIAVSPGGKSIVITTQKGAYQMTTDPSPRTTPADAEVKKATGFDDAVLAKIDGPEQAGGNVKIVGDPNNPDVQHMVVSYGIYDKSPQLVAYTKTKDGPWVKDPSSTGLNHLPSTAGITSLAVDPKNPQSIYIGTGDQAYHLNPATQQWSQVTLPLVTNPKKVKDFFSPDSNISSINLTGGLHLTSCWGVFTPSKAPGAGPDDVVRSTSANFVWKNHQANPSGGLLRATDIEVNPKNSDQMILTSASGVYTTADGGKDWKKYEGLPDCVSSLNKSVPVDPNQCAALVGQQEGRSQSHDSNIPAANHYPDCNPNASGDPTHRCLKNTSMGLVDSNLYLTNYRMAHFNPDGSVIVSSESGTYLANPFSPSCR